METKSAEVVVGGDDLDATTRFFADLGFRLLMIMPAERPRVALLEGFGLRLRVDTERPAGATVLLLPTDDRASPARLTAPNGTIVEFVPTEADLVVPAVQPSFVLSRAADASWVVGRAGMAYRDLIPDRQGGRFVASHIHLPDGGPVPDYVHHHRIRFQMIYCYRGWAELVYQDQGPPFRFSAGDCVLQPPNIRHQVLETSPAFDVVELGCPAEHETLRDHDLDLPNGERRPDRTHGGQRFVHHRHREATWRPWHVDGYEHRDLGITAATDGLAGARVLRPIGSGVESGHRHEGELLFWFVLSGTGRLVEHSGNHWLGPTDSVVLAPGEGYVLSEVSADLEILEVTLPA